ncbi:MAG: GTP-binding protein, partial [Candidatus Omnitrophica bacterium]|nr:GTP-binding protein [Candidatus Omnitrophota bacterium]
TTQVFFQTRKRRYVIIDAPGHAEFIKNMITGATQAEVAVLIVDAKEGLKEQTKRHAYLVSMLNLEKLVVVINKMDLVNFSQGIFNQVKGELTQFLNHIKLSASYFIPISAKNGDNVLRRSRRMAWYRGPTLLKALDSLALESQEKDRPLRFSVQDVYTIDGEKIIVGRVESGVIKRGESVFLFPALKEKEVKSIRVFNQYKETAKEGENIGITLNEPVFVQRGNIICQGKNLPKLMYKFNSSVFWMSSEPLRVKQKVIVRCATQELVSYVERIEKRINSSSLEVLEDKAEQINLNEVAQVTFKNDAPLVMEEFHFIEELGRIVIEDKSTGNIQGAGIVKFLDKI